LIATFTALTLSSARYTVPNDPSPISLTNLYWPTRV